jgi:dTDP-4-amino-4,6-dideoxygalactose transaminase
MDVPFLELKQQYLSIKREIDQAIAGILDNCNFILGEPVKELEERIARYCGVKHGVAVASGTDALYLSLKACGIGAGDEVITSSYSFFASAGTIWNTGAEPVFVDIDPGTFNLDASKVKEKITSRTRAVMPVHLFGQCADMKPLLELAADSGFTIIEDAAQAIGATYQGRKTGSMGTVGCFSFYPSKNLGAYGDGGMIVTDDASIADRIRLLRVHGARPKYFHKVIGINSRLDTLQAAVLLVKLGYLDSWSEKRRRNAAVYDGLFRNTEVVIPEVLRGNVSIYNQYVLRVPKRETVREFLKKRGIGTDVYYPLPLHLQECFKELGYERGQLPHAENASLETLAIPIYPELTLEQQEYVAAAIMDALRET